MRLLVLLCSIALTINGFSQKRFVDEESFQYSVNGAPRFFTYTTTHGTTGVATETFSEEFKYAAQDFRFTRASVVKHPVGGYNIVLIQFDNIAHDPNHKDPKKRIVDPHDGSSTYINNQDNKKMFWIKEEDFNEYLNDNFIIRRYSTKPSVGYGTTLSLPFKMRAETKGEPMRITPEITLGGYFGPRFRLNKFRSVFLTLPVTLGVTTIGINENNTIKEQTPSQEGQEDALVVGRTISTGAVLEYRDFQLGYIMGWDKAGGDLGKQWLYNDKIWYSFSIGFAFFNRSTAKKAQ